MRANDKLRAMLKRHEGLRLRAYLCPAGKWSIGYGRNLEDTGIEQIEANFMLTNDIERVLKECTFAFPWFNLISVTRQDVICSMVFQMGMGGFKTFKKMISALSAQDYARAADEMLDSTWAKQTPFRAQELATIMRTGNYPS